MHAFFAERETRRDSGLADEPAAPVRSAGVVGAGTMGGGIAICFANAGIPVTLLDASREALDRGLANIDATYQSMVDRGRLTADEKAQRMALIRGSLDYDDLRDADVIIEAVFESMDLKSKIFATLDEVAKPARSSRPTPRRSISTQIAAATARPRGRHRHALLLARERHAAARSRAHRRAHRRRRSRTVMDLAKPLRKTPVLAKVCYGFIGNRMMEGYAREAERMVLEGATPRQVDSALEEWGMAMGILAVFDMAGIDVGVNVHKANAAQYPAGSDVLPGRLRPVRGGPAGAEERQGLLPLRAGQSRAHRRSRGASRSCGARAASCGIAQREHTEQEIVERCLYPLLNEGMRILEEGIALRASDIDVVWTAGYGFPRYRGGPMFYADTIGLQTLLEGMRKYSDIFGPMHWEPAPLLVELVERGLEHRASGKRTREEAQMKSKS